MEFRKKGMERYRKNFFPIVSPTRWFKHECTKIFGIFIQEQQNDTEVLRRLDLFRKKRYMECIPNGTLCDLGLI